MNRRDFVGNMSRVAVGGAAAYGLAPGLTSSVAAQSRSAIKDPIVETTAGKVRGRVDDGVYVFKGIHYGDSTAGNMRFMPPAKPKPWPGVRDAFEFGQRSPQGDGTGNHGEDCLVLNVWTRGLNDGGRRPVMVWLHGGGYSTGAADDPGAGGLSADGVNLCNRGDVVVVTINKRLNIFGWLFLADIAGEKYAASGAAGMLDQVAALQWIRENIGRFGGDPNNVTIWGVAGGARKTSTLLSMPAAKGLFHRAIIESGAQLRIFPRELATEMTTALLRELGLQVNQVQELHNLPWQRLNAARAAVESRQNAINRERGIYVQLGYCPVVDGTYLPTHNCDPFAPALSADIPLLIGTNKHESGNFLYRDPKITSGSLTEEELRTRVEGFTGTAAKRILDFYRDTHPQSSPAERYALITSHRAFGFDVLTFAERKMAQRRAPVYKYQFAWEAPDGSPGWRAYHQLENSFVFDNTTKAPRDSGGGPRAAALAAKVSEAWIAFARTGNPSTSGLTWPAYSKNERQVMVLNNESKTTYDPSVAERHVWATSYIGLTTAGTS